MARSVEAYRRQEVELPRKPVPKIMFIILFILVLFIYHSYSDASLKIESTHSNKEEKAKLCLGEFAQKGCDSINPTPECKRLLNCFEQKK